jgi:hypothetical protein
MRRNLLPLLGGLAVLFLVLGIYSNPGSDQAPSRTATRDFKVDKKATPTKRGQPAKANPKRQVRTFPAPSSPAPVVAPAAEPLATPPPAQPAPVEAKHTHAMDLDGIRGAMREASGEIKACYETYLSSYPDEAGGKITLEFDIEGRGDHSVVTGATVAESSVASLYMEGCVVTSMEDVAFEAKPDGEVATVSWPFVFRNEPTDKPEAQSE